MPRLAPQLLHQARRRGRHLLGLLNECRDLESATNELRWLTEHAQQLPVPVQLARKPDDHRLLWLWRRHSLAGFIQRRARGEPLQYIIGDQPFGELEILCRPGVLIPRPETEIYSRTIATLLESLTAPGSEVKVLDLCSGTGCIGLLLHSVLRNSPLLYDTSSSAKIKRLLITGLDISDTALKLAHQNLEHNMRLGVLHPKAREEINFQSADLLGPAEQVLEGHSLSKSGFYDVVVSNPPYISPTDYGPGSRVTRSVRKYEPLLALVPPPAAPPPETGNDVDDQHLQQQDGDSDPEEERADRFYSRILQVSRLARARLICMEVGDARQAARVAGLAAQFSTDHSATSADESVEPDLVEVWCDDGHVSQVDVQPLQHEHQQHKHIRGCERAVVVWRGAWARWRRITVSEASTCGRY